MAQGQEKLLAAIVTKLRTDTGSGSLVDLTGHLSSDPNSYRILRDKPPKVAEVPFLGVQITQSVPLSETATYLQVARVYFACYAGDALTSIKIADRIEHLLHGRAEDASAGTNRGYYDFSNQYISNRQTRFKIRSEPDFDEKTDVWTTVVEADVIWLDVPCPDED